MMDVILIILIITELLCLYISFESISDLNKLVTTHTETIERVKEELSSINEDIKQLKENPAEFTKRFSMVDFRLKKMEDTLTTFNNGFRSQESWMR